MSALKDEATYYGLANFFKNFEAVGGVLYLTNCQLVHIPHKANMQTVATIIELSDVVEVKPRKTMVVIPNGIVVKTNQGNEFKFVVYRRNKWIKEINTCLEQLKNR